MKITKTAVLAIVASLAAATSVMANTNEFVASSARADNPALGEVDAPGAATGRYMGGRPGVERPLHQSYHYHRHAHRHHSG